MSVKLIVSESFLALLLTMRDIDLSRPLLLSPQFKHRVWGWNEYTLLVRGRAPGTIGEAWFTAPDNLLGGGMEFGELLRSHPELLGSAGDPTIPTFVRCS